MVKHLIFLLLAITCTFAVQLRQEKHAIEEWDELDIDDLTDEQYDLEQFVRDAIGRIDGDLTGASQNGDTYKFLYGDN